MTTYQPFKVVIMLLHSHSLRLYLSSFAPVLHDFQTDYLDQSGSVHLRREFWVWLLACWKNCRQIDQITNSEGTVLLKSFHFYASDFKAFPGFLILHWTSRRAHFQIPPSNFGVRDNEESPESKTKTRSFLLFLLSRFGQSYKSMFLPVICILLVSEKTILIIFCLYLLYIKCVIVQYLVFGTCGTLEHLKAYLDW